MIRGVTKTRQSGETGPLPDVIRERKHKRKTRLVSRKKMEEAPMSNLNAELTATLRGVATVSWKFSPGARPWASCSSVARRDKVRYGYEAETKRGRSSFVRHIDVSQTAASKKL